MCKCPGQGSHWASQEACSPQWPALAADADSYRGHLSSPASCTDVPAPHHTRVVHHIGPRGVGGLQVSPAASQCPALSQATVTCQGPRTKEGAHEALCKLGLQGTSECLQANTSCSSSPDTRLPQLSPSPSGAKRKNLGSPPSTAPATASPSELWAPLSGPSILHTPSVAKPHHPGQDSHRS